MGAEPSAHFARKCANSPLLNPPRPAPNLLTPLTPRKINPTCSQPRTLCPVSHRLDLARSIQHVLPPTRWKSSPENKSIRPLPHRAYTSPHPAHGRVLKCTEPLKCVGCGRRGCRRRDRRRVQTQRASQSPHSICLRGVKPEGPGVRNLPRAEPAKRAWS